MKAVNYLFSVLIALIATHLPLPAQQEGCGAAPSPQAIAIMDSLQRECDIYTAGFLENPRLMPAAMVPVQVHIIRQNNGVGGLSISEWNSALNTLNAYYQSANMQFFECAPPNIINSTAYYNFSVPEESALHAAHGVDDVVNIYVPGGSLTNSSGDELCGYAYFPWSNAPDLTVIKSSCMTNGSTFAHEIGHFFGLYHTHGTSNCGLSNELANGSNCNIAGDNVCDTPADPNLLNLDCAGSLVFDCIYIGQLTDANGQFYNPDVSNIMSYAPPSCRNFLSGGQFARASFYNLNGRSYLNCAAAACSPPAGLSVSSAGHAYGEFTWGLVSNASAYQTRIRAQGSSSWIEGNWYASTSVSWGNVTPCTTYEIQVRADCGGTFSNFSSSVLFNTQGCGALYCYSYGLSWDHWIESVSVAQISNNSGSDLGYADFSSLSADVQAGQNYSISLQPGTDVGTQTVYWRVWIDKNRDNDFEDAGEMVLQATGNNQSVINQAITIPADAATGSTRMRVSMDADGYPGPCTVNGVREVEDYSLNISPSPFITISPDNQDVGFQMGCATYSVNSNINWTVSSGANWLTSIDPGVGSGNGSFTVCYQENTGQQSRMAVLAVSGNNASGTATLSQAEQPLSLSFSPASISLNWQGDPVSGALSITGNASWTATPSHSWLQVVPGQGAGSRMLSISADDNPGGSSRTGSILLQSGAESFTLAVTQAGQVNPVGNPPWGEPYPTIASGVLRGQGQVSGLPAAAEDWVGAFDEEGNLAGSARLIVVQGIAYINLTIYGDDSGTPGVDEGINSGEAFTLSLYDASEGRILDYPYPGATRLFSQWENTNGAPMPAYANINDIYNFEDAAEDIIPLTAGWNLVSTDVIPADSSVAAIMAGLLPGNLEFVTGFDGGANFYDPGGLPFLNSLMHFKRGFGYWVKVGQIDTIRLSGAALDAGYFKPMDEGWNLIAYLPQAPQSPGAYLGALLATGQLEYVTGFEDGSVFYDPNGPPFLNTLQQMRNSQGYWVKLQDVAAGAQMHSAGQAPTPVYEFIGGQVEGLENGEIEVQDSQGHTWAVLPIGWGGMVRPAPIYGDDPLTPQQEGPQPGTRLYFVNKGLKSAASKLFQGERSLSYLTFDFTMPDAESTLLAIRPNPFREVLQINYSMPRRGKAEIVVQDMLGRQFARLPQGTRDAGEHQLIWAPPGAPPGLYWITLFVDGQAAGQQKASLSR